MSPWPNLTIGQLVWRLFHLFLLFVHLLFHLLSPSSAFLTFAATLLGVLGAVLAWAYQVGSARLGVVDLFACEISTLCRVALVVDTVDRYIEEFDKGPKKKAAADDKSPPRTFTSQESYFPVFENDSRDLQTLEAKVVINITAFYTYMKAVRDYLRALAAVEPQPSDLQPPTGEAPPGSWREALRNVIHMLFLALERGRQATHQLVEFEPEQVERTVVILISELAAYRFLCSQYQDPTDIHYQRIRLHEYDYLRDVPPLLESLAQHARIAEQNPLRSDWEPALRLADKLNENFKAAVGPLAAGAIDA